MACAASVSAAASKRRRDTWDCRGKQRFTKWTCNWMDEKMNSCKKQIFSTDSHQDADGCVWSPQTTSGVNSNKLHEGTSFFFFTALTTTEYQLAYLEAKCRIWKRDVLTNSLMQTIELWSNSVVMIDSQEVRLQWLYQANSTKTTCCVSVHDDTSIGGLAGSIFCSVWYLVY